MMRGDEMLQADHFFVAKAGLDRGRLGSGHQGATVLRGR
jgi:hypothetical protein